MFALVLAEYIVLTVLFRLPDTHTTSQSHTMSSPTPNATSTSTFTTRREDGQLVIEDIPDIPLSLQERSWQYQVHRARVFESLNFSNHGLW